MIVYNKCFQPGQWDIFSLVSNLPTIRAASHLQFKWLEYLRGAGRHQGPAHHRSSRILPSNRTGVVSNKLKNNRFYSLREFSSVRTIEMRPTAFAGTIFDCTLRVGDQYWVRGTTKLEVRVYAWSLPEKAGSRCNWFYVAAAARCSCKPASGLRVFEFQTVQQKRIRYNLFPIENKLFQ